MQQDTETQKEEQPSASIVDWKETGAKITAVRFLNGENHEVSGITEGDRLTIEIHYAASKLIEGPVFSLTFYLPDGRALIAANSRLAQSDFTDNRIDFIEGSGIVRFIFDPFPAGACDLVMSTSIFEYLEPKTFDGQQPLLRPARPRL